jgi:hypothetical protein
MNRTVDPWSLPWHARLKDLADGLRGEGAVDAALTARSRTARQVTARIVANRPGSWMVRARTRGSPMHPAGR